MNVIIKWILALFGVIIFLASITIQPVDRTHFLESDYYQIASSRLDSIKTNFNSITNSHLNVGWAKVNITPKSPTPLSGYGNRKGAISIGVHDSLFARCFVFNNNNESIAFITLDALLVPPAVTLQLLERLPSIGYDLNHVYLTATHTHSSMGAWGNSYIGELFAGEFDQNIVNQLSTNIINAIQKAEKNISHASIGYAK
jgi:hypothetical protein